MINHFQHISYQIIFYSVVTCLQFRLIGFENFNLEEIVTLVKVNKFEQILRESSYDKFDTENFQFLVNGIKHGFPLGFEGDRKDMKQRAPNIRFTVGDKFELWQKVMKEVKLKRYAGPYEVIPYENYIQSPIGLVPKDGWKATRLIFHLSYPKKGTSVNAQILKNKCSVKYPDFEEAIRLCQSAEKSANAVKSDMSSAFRNLPMSVIDFCLLIMMAKHLITGKTYFFLDKHLPFRSSISCAIFQKFSDAISYVVTFKSDGKPNVNYLDDFLFVALLRQHCREQVELFIRIWREINFPVAMDKTTWGDTVIIFLGLLIDTVCQIVCIPIEKIEKALTLINRIQLNKRNKATLLQIQQLVGFLNFLCKAIIPSRPFTAWLYALTANDKLKPHHHVKVPLDVWRGYHGWCFGLLSSIYWFPWLDCWWHFAL